MDSNKINKCFCGLFRSSVLAVYQLDRYCSFLRKFVTLSNLIEYHCYAQTFRKNTAKPLSISIPKLLLPKTILMTFAAWLRIIKHLN